ncbi:tRNA (N6-isopentenyl adenosine(37)-C2)-methylthiotransferase MiaB [Candidatus Peregrinibacteria bacterium]|nr:tRNA (N6-isopentenyl adenosine(37)-C2)-methylthiotransferase MiaB [Candidatus Peregrinibacteria bacterium]
MKKFYLRTFGCQMNYSDSERIKAVLERLGYHAANSPASADLIMLNTCSVRQHAEDRIFGLMLKYEPLRRKNKRLLIGLTGCMVRKTSSRADDFKDKILRRIRPLDFTIRIEEIAKLPEILGAVSGRAVRKTITSARQKIQPRELKNYFHITPKYTSRFQVFIPISTGCDKFCSYCIVPFSRGRETNRPMKDILKEARAVVKNGCKEITLVGQTVNSYKNFPKLLVEIDKLNKFGLERVRFTSPYPLDVTDDLIKAIARLKTLIPYIHLPIQSGDNEVLKRMNRKYTVQQYENIVRRIRARIPNCAISTDIIVGFPGETREQFMNTYNLFKKIKWDMAYLAQYSPRPGTLSAKMLKDNVPQKEKKQRWNMLNNLLRRVSLSKHKKFVGRKVRVLVESYKNGLNMGRSEHFKIIQFKSKKSLVGKIVPVKIVKAYEWILQGKVLTDNNNPVKIYSYN